MPPTFDPVGASVILVIDDSPEMQKLLEHRLRGQGYEVRSASNGHDGIEAAQAHTPSLILLDLAMPVMDGFETLRELKEIPTLMHVPVIVLSGSDDARDKVAGLELGAVDYVCKPFDSAELHARVRSAMRVHKLMRMLAQRAQIDGLTGLWNRTYFDERLESEIGASRRTGEPLTLAMCDFDHFKEINDSYGHPAGDAVLEGFARIITSELRSHDIACRYGGEEFAMIFRNAGVEQARAILERIRQKLEATVWPAHPERCVTASFGIAGFTPAVRSAEGMLREADAALYSAKQRGRNRVLQAPQSGDRLAS